MQCTLCGQNSPSRYYFRDEGRTEPLVCRNCARAGAGARPAPASQVPAPSALHVTGKFRKLRIEPLRRVGQYRGEGALTFGNDGFRVSGRHVLSMDVRWGIGLSLFVGILIVTGGLFAPGWIPLYLLVEYVWLTREDLSVRFDDVQGFAADARRELIAIAFAGSSWCSPVVLKTPHWRQAFELLQARAPAANGTPCRSRTGDPIAIRPPLSRGRALWNSAWVLIGWYLLGFALLGAMVNLALALINLGSIEEMRNPALRALTLTMVFIAPLAVAGLLARRYFLRRTAPSPEIPHPRVAA